MNEITTIPVRAIKAAMHAAATKDIRFYLMGVHIEHCNGVLHVVGCDGSILFACRLPGWQASLAGDWSLTIPLDTCKLALKASATWEALTLKGEPGPGKACQLGSIAFTSVDGKYPDWRRVTPALNATFELTPLQYDQGLMSRAFDAIGEFDQRPKKKVSWGAFVHRLETSAVVTGKDGQAYCVVMPRRDTEDLHRIQWFKADYPTVAKAA